jgi:hypothetical protein
MQGWKCVRENSVVPPGLESLLPLSPALKRWAKLDRPSGARGWKAWSTQPRMDQSIIAAELRSAWDGRGRPSLHERGKLGRAGFFFGSTRLGVLVAQIVRRRSRGLVLVVVLVLSVVIMPATGQARPSPGSRGRKRMALAADKTFREGVHAKLPPHLSTLLGISGDGVSGHAKCGADRGGGARI